MTIKQKIQVLIDWFEATMHNEKEHYKAAEKFDWYSADTYEKLLKLKEVA